jgi:hypothetical protein
MRTFWSRLLIAATALSLLFFLTAPAALGQLESHHVNKTPYCTVATLATCANQGPGRLAYLTDGDDSTDTTSGGGSHVHLAMYTSAWKPIAFADEDRVTQEVIFCGQADEAGTIYLGPATAVTLGDGSASYAIGSVGCDALDNATEATADAPLYTDVAFKVLGGICVTDGTLSSETVIFTMRSAAADTSPVQTCTISDASDCSFTTATTTDVAAGATVAIKAVQIGDNADDNLWCKVTIALQ